ncbi:MAG TPA: glycosyltransferase [Methanobacteriaceae archaeon]|nr:glycosyltransferase [Methanobacteriaceae archaeon]
MSWIILIFVLIIASVKKRAEKNEMTVSVIIPAFNEYKTVSKVVEVVKSLKYVEEIIVVDDGSTDGTADVAREAGATVISHVKNRGKGAAIKTGFNNSKGDIAVFLDADIQNLTTQKVEKIIKPILSGEADVTKTKFKREAGRVTELTAKPLLNFFFPEIKFEQPLSGQFAAKRSFLKDIKLEDDYGVDVGIVLDADVRGMRIKEVDIGKIDHVLSSLHELNMVATEVVRTIVDRATEYGRITMIDTLGKHIRMGLLGLSLATLGFFCVFFIRFFPVQLGLIIIAIGAIIAFFYIIRILKTSFRSLFKSDSKSRNLKSFFYMHSPMLVSGLIMVAMLATLLGSVHVDEGKISIEPASRNLIIWKDPLENKSFDIRGPYLVDSALENEYTMIRAPPDAMSTLGLSYGDNLFINNQRYSMMQNLPGEENVIRIPFDARNYFGLNVRDVIPDTNLRNIFKNLYAEKSIVLQDAGNITAKEGVILRTGTDDAKNINIYLNNTKISTSTGIIHNGTYSIYVNGAKYRDIIINEDKTKNTYYISVGRYTLKIEIEGNVKSDMEIPTSDKGTFLNFIT